MICSNGDRPFRVLGALTLALLGFGACDDVTAPAGDARVEVQLTDAPTDMLDSARVWISTVYLQGGDEDAEDDDASGRVYLFQADEISGPKSFELLALRDGVVADLAAADVEARNYGQLRLVVDSSRVYLAEGFQMADGATSTSLRIPSGSTSGIKVLLNSPIEAESGDTQIIVVDFDVDDAFQFQSVGSDGVIQDIRFGPVLKESGRSTEEGTAG